MRILLVRTDGLGDALVCAPLVAALRDAGHALGALLSTNNAGAFAPCAFDAVHVVERIPWPRHGSTPESRSAALAAVRARAYDLALVASEEVDAYAFARDAGIARRVGFVNGWQKPFKTLAVRPLLTRAIGRPASASAAREHEVRTLFALGAGLHAEGGPTRDVARLRALVLDGGDGLPAAGDRVVVQAVTKYVARGLDRTTYAAIVDALAARGLRPTVLGDDDAFASAIVREATRTRTADDGLDPGVELATGLGLDAWKARIASARAVVTPDSGAAHVAGMTGVPCVDLFAPHAALERDVARWHPWAAPYRARALDAAVDARTFAALVAADLDTLLGAAVRA